MKEGGGKGHKASIPLPGPVVEKRMEDLPHGRRRGGKKTSNQGERYTIQEKEKNTGSSSLRGGRRR